MESKANIVALFVLCMAWQAHASDNCNSTGPGKFPDTADTTCQGFTLCVHNNNTDSLIALSFICPNNTIFDPDNGNCVFGSNYTCNGSNSTSPGNNGTDSSLTCNEEGTFANPNSTNCDTYIKCVEVNGTLVESIHECPNNTIFDFDYGNCVFGSNYTCSGSNSTAPGNNGTDSGDGNTNSTLTCNEEGIFANPNSINCVTYIKCVEVNGTLTESVHSCPNNTIFDFDYGNCVFGSNYTCNGSNSTSPGNNGSDSGDSNTNSTLTCNEEGIFPNPNSTNCDTYIKCLQVNGTLTESVHSCPNNTIFNPDYGYCVFGSNYTCNGSNSTAPGNNGTDSGDGNTNCTLTCNEEGIFANPNSTNCDTYIKCLQINGTLTESFHSCPNNTIFDPNYGFCVFGSNYSCNGSNGTYPGPGNNNTNSTSICTEEGFFAKPDSYNCSTYVGCVKINGTFVEHIYSCPSNTFFNPNTTFCEANYTCNKTVEPFVCTSTGRFPDVYDVTCQSFFLCTEGVKGTFIQQDYTCPSPSVFSPISRVCTTSYSCNVTASLRM